MGICIHIYARICRDNRQCTTFNPLTCHSLRRQELSCSPAGWILTVLQLVCRQCVLMLIFHSLPLWVICPFFLEFSRGGRHLFEAIAYIVKLPDKKNFDMLFIKSFVFFSAHWAPALFQPLFQDLQLETWLIFPPALKEFLVQRDLPKVQFRMASV